MYSDAFRCLFNFSHFPFFAHLCSKDSEEILKPEKEEPKMAQKNLPPGENLLHFKKIEPKIAKINTAHSKKTSYIKSIEEKSEKVTLIIILQCTSAFTTPNEIDNVISFLEKNKTKHDAAFAASLFHGFIWKYDINKKIANGINHSSSKARERRQVIKEKQYLELGSVYAVKRESFISSQSRFGFNPKPIPVDSINSYLEIDTFKDLEIANSISLNHR